MTPMLSTDEAVQGSATAGDPFGDSVLKAGRIPNLDGLRAASIFLVLFHHCPNLDWLGTLHANGRYGVALFFVISGFLITTLFLREQRRFGRVDMWRFYGRRCLRLFPLYYAVLGVYAVLVLGLGFFTQANQSLFVEKLPAYLLYYSNLVPRATEGPFFFAWSLAVEEQFYLVSGLMVVLFSKRSIVWLFVAALAVKMIAFQTPSAAVENELLWKIGFSYREPILWGVLLAYFVSTRAGFQFFHQTFCRTWVTLALAAYCLGHMTLLLEPNHSAWSAQIWYVVATLLVGSCALSRPFRLMESRPIVHFGVISYGMYLMHMLVINALSKFTADPILIFLLAILGTTALASLSYHFFEKPILRLKDRLQPNSASNRAKLAAIPAAGSQASS